MGVFIFVNEVRYFFHDCCYFFPSKGDLYLNVWLFFSLWSVFGGAGMLLYECRCWASTVCWVSQWVGTVILVHRLVWTGPATQEAIISLPGCFPPLCLPPWPLPASFMEWARAGETVVAKADSRWQCCCKSLRNHRFQPRDFPVIPCWFRSPRGSTFLWVMDRNSLQWCGARWLLILCSSDVKMILKKQLS